MIHEAAWLLRLSSACAWWCIHCLIIVSILHLERVDLHHHASMAGLMMVLQHAPRRANVIAGSFVLTVAAYYWARASDPGWAVRPRHAAACANLGAEKGEKVVFTADAVFDMQGLHMDIEMQGRGTDTCAVCSSRQLPSTKHCLLVSGASMGGHTGQQRGGSRAT